MVQSLLLWSHCTSRAWELLGSHHPCFDNCCKGNQGPRDIAMAGEGACVIIIHAWQSVLRHFNSAFKLQVSDLQSDALFILLVEKDAAFMRLAEDRFYNTYPCIILTAKGQPDVASRWRILHHSFDARADAMSVQHGRQT